MAKKKPQARRTDRRQPTGRKAIETMKLEDGAGLDGLAGIERKYNRNPLKQWQVLARTIELPALIGLERDAADRTRDLYIARGEAMIRTLPKIGVHIQQLRHFSVRHARAYLNYMQAQGKSSATIKNNMTTVRRLLVWMGKANTVDAIDAMMREAGVEERTFVVTVSKTLRSQGFRREELFEAAAGEDRIFGCQIKLCLLFGLRRKESWHLRPGESDKGDHLRVFRGTKGSKSRNVPIKTPEQRAALDEAKALAAATYAGGALTWPRLSSEQAQERFKNHCKNIGLTADGDFKTTPHGLRHEFACDEYFRLCGCVAQIESGVPVDPEVDRAARKALAEILGHGRLEVCGAYIGSNRIVAMEADKRQKALFERFQQPEVREPLLEAGITCLRLVGRVAAGSTDTTADTLCGYEGSLTDDEAELEDLVALLVKVVGGPCTLLPLTNALRARTDRLEVI